MRRLILLLAVTLICLPFYCSENPTASIDDEMVGTWDWMRSVGGNPGYIDPERCECTQQYEFNPGGTFRLFFNNEVVDAGSYHTAYEKDSWTGENYLMLYLDDQKSRIIYKLSELIFLSPPACLACPDSVVFYKFLPE